MIREEAYVRYREFDKLSNELKKYAPKHIILDIQDDIKDLGSKEEINAIKHELSYMKKSNNVFIDKDECITRLNTIAA